MTNNLIKDNIQLDSTKLTRDGADGYSSALFELHLQLHSQVVNPYTFNPKQNYNSYSTLKESYNYDGVYGPIPDENGFVDLTDYASLYIPDYQNIITIPEENQKYLNSGILPTSMESSFFNCFNLQSIDLSKINFKNCISFENMFNKDDKDETMAITEILGISNWDTSSLENINNFILAPNIKLLDLSLWNTNNLKYVSDSAITINRDSGIVDISNWNLNNLIFDSMKDDGWISICCHKLIAKNCNISKLTDLSYLFSGIVFLTTILDVSNWKTSNIVKMHHTFGFRTYEIGLRGDLSEIIGLETWDISNVEDLEGCFHGNSQFNSDISTWNVSKVKSMKWLFYDTIIINNIDLSSWNVTNVTDFSGMFSNSSLSQESANKLINWDMANATDVSSMFSYLRLTNFDFIKNWNLSNVQDISSFFSRNYVIENITVSKVFPINSKSKITNIRNLFEGCNKLTTIDISNWDTSKINNFTQLFDGTTSLINIIGNKIIDMGSATSCISMFDETSITGIHLKNVPRSLDLSKIGGTENTTYIIDNYIG